MQLNDEEIQRYSRHISLPDIGLAGQKKICSTSVLCLGAGGLGSSALLYLAAAGLGKIGLVDDDQVELSNLPRQIVHGTADLNRPKTESARDRLMQINPNVEIAVHKLRLTSDQALEIIRPYDLVVDATDNFPTRYLINDACALLRKPNIHGSVLGFEGQVTVFAPHLGGPCYRCLYPEPPPPATVPTCGDSGVFNVLPGLIGSLQAAEAIKLALGKGGMLIGRLIWINALETKFREIKLRRDPACPLCGEKPTLHKLMDYTQFCGLVPPLAGRNLNPDEVTVQDLKRALDEPSHNIKVIDVRDPEECHITRIQKVMNIPLTVLPQRYTELDPNQILYLHCRNGVRSMKAVKFLKEKGFKSVKSVRGGLSAWVDEIEVNVPKS